RGRPAHWESRTSLEEELREGEKRFTPELLEAYLAATHREGTGLAGSPAEARGAAMWGLLAPVSEAWPVLARERIPTLLLLATEEPHVEQNREHLPHFKEAVPQAEVWWMEGAGHGILADVGPGLGDTIALWLDQKLA